MPELGEVDLLATRLNTRLREMSAQPRLVAGRADHARFAEMWSQCAPNIVGARLERVWRKGKYLVFQWSEGRGLMLGHLRMTGWWEWQQSPQSITLAQGYTLNRNPKLFLSFRWPKRKKAEELVYYDSRVLGEIAYFNTTEWRNIPALSAQAPDFIDTDNSLPGSFISGEEEFLALVAAARARGTRRTIRDVLMDQSRKGIGAGLGNYIIAEVLYRAGIHPNRPFSELTKRSLVKLYQITCEIFRHVIATGAESEATMVIYQRERCPRGHAIMREARGNRGSYYCPRCQRL